MAESEGRKWFYRRGDQELGPVRGRDLRALAIKGELSPTDMIRREGDVKWVPAGRSASLFRPSPELEDVAMSGNLAASAMYDDQDLGDLSSAAHSARGTSSANIPKQQPGRGTSSASLPTQPPAMGTSSANLQRQTPAGPGQVAPRPRPGLEDIVSARPSRESTAAMPTTKAGAGGKPGGGIQKRGNTKDDLIFDLNEPYEWTPKRKLIAAAAGVVTLLIVALLYGPMLFSRGPAPQPTSRPAAKAK